MYNANGDKVVRKFLPVQIYDVHGIELWLEELSAQGLILDSFGFRRSAIFRPGNPEPGVRYRLEPSIFRADKETPESRGKADWETVDYEKNAEYARYGWEYVDNIPKFYTIYRCRDRSAEELHTDPVTLGYLFQRICAVHTTWLLILALILLSRLLERFLLPSDGAGYSASLLFIALDMLTVNPLCGAFFLLLLAWFFLLCLIDARNTRRLWKLRRRLADGIPPERDRRYPCSPLWNAAAVAVPMVLLCGLCITFLLTPRS